MTWALLLFLLPLPLFVIIAVRTLRVVRQFQDPEQLRGLLSTEARIALQRAGVSPDQIRLEDLQESEEAARIVGEEVRRLLREAALGIRWSKGSVSRRDPVDADHGALPASGLLHPKVLDSSRGAALPPPIEAPRSASPRLVIALLFLGLAAVGFVLLNG